MDILDIFMSTKDVEGVGVELASDTIKDLPANMESGLFIIGEGSIGSSQDFVKPRAAVQRVDSVRLESDNIRSWSSHGLVVGPRTLDDRE